MSSNADISARVKQAIEAAGIGQGALAERIGLRADQMSRAVRAQRGFSSIELAEIADATNVDVYWLITGSDDPMRVRIAARHVYDKQTGQHSNPSRSSDEQELQAVALAYRQVYVDDPHPTPALPGTAAEVRAALGEGFAPYFADRLEVALDVDVIRLQKLKTAYSFTVGGRMVVLLPTNPNWFRSNFDLAHEIGHLALGHHSTMDEGGECLANEAPANAFAAELLLPAELMRAEVWETMSGEAAARFLWSNGVGTDVLRLRLNTLKFRPSAEVAALLGRPMPGALRGFNYAGDETVAPAPASIDSLFSVVRDRIDERMQQASQRRFPATLIAAHRKAIDEHRLPTATLAWMLDAPDQDIFDDKSSSAGDIDDLMSERLCCVVRCQAAPEPRSGQCAGQMAGLSSSNVAANLDCGVASIASS
jgi:transcriptional regulator with XRE-family HTH domain